MHAHLHRNRTQRRNFAQQSLPILHVGVVRFVVAEERPHRRIRTFLDRGVHMNTDYVLRRQR